MKSYIALILICAAASGNQTRWVPNKNWYEKPRPTYRLTEGYVTHKETAIAIGRAVVADAYGEDTRKDQEPFDAKRFGDVWVVYGYLPLSDPSKGIAIKGGVTAVEIDATSGSILSTTREK